MDKSVSEQRTHQEELVNKRHFRGCWRKKKNTSGGVSGQRALHGVDTSEDVNEQRTLQQVFVNKDTLGGVSE